MEPLWSPQMIGALHRGLVPGFVLIVITGCSAGGAGPITLGTAGKLGGSAKNGTCRNTEISSPRDADDSACDACGANKCSGEAAALLGSDPNAYGGACGTHQQCVCDCDAKNQACEGACDEKAMSDGTEGACDQAVQRAIACLAEKCPDECRHT